jgi:arsenical-resistance protein 2
MAIKPVVPEPNLNQKRVHGHGHGHSHGHEHHHHGPNEHCLRMALREDGTPWWTAFPEPRSVAPRLDPEDVYRLLKEREGLCSEADSASSGTESSSAGTGTQTETEGGLPGDVLLVDTRRTDCTGGTVRGAINVPAHSFYPTRGVLYDLCKRAGVKTVIFYCGEFLKTSRLVLMASISPIPWKPPASLPDSICDCHSARFANADMPGPTKASSLGRGPRCAAWMQDYVDEVGGDLQCRVLNGGIRGWVQAYGGEMMDGFDEKVWQSKEG